MNKESILQEAQRLIHGPRREKYGHPLDNFEHTAALLNAMLSRKLKEPLTPEDAMLIMVQVKVSRQIHVPSRDNLTDIAGYVGCIELAEQERDRRKPK